MADAPEKASAELCSALLGAHFLRWRREKHPYPVQLPPGLDAMMPMPMSRIAPMMEGGVASDSANVATYHMRSSIAAALAPEGPGREPRDSWRRRGWDRELHNFIGDVADDIFPDDETKASSTLYACVAAYHAMWKRCQEDRHVGGDAVPDVIRDQPKLEFDPETWITTASEDVEFDDVPREAALEFFKCADPRNWDAAFPEFFEGTEVGEWTASDGWQEHRPPIEGDPESFQILERVKWNFSPETQGGGINVLQITGFELVPKSQLHRDDKDLERAFTNLSRDLKQFVHEPDVGDEICSIKYSYRLYHCVQTKLINTWEPGGLDVDEGTYHATWTPGKKQRGLGNLHIVASKSIRYTQQRNLPEGFASLMNLLAPSIIGMLMRQLSHDGVLKFLLARQQRPLERPPLARPASGVERIGPDELLTGTEIAS
jgi:hypothetical protein